MWPTWVVWPESPLVSRLAIQTRLSGIGEGQRPQDQRIDDAEDRRAGADAEAGDEDGEGREAGVAAQRADGVAEILEKVVEAHGESLDGISDRFRWHVGRWPLAAGRWPIGDWSR